MGKATQALLFRWDAWFVDDLREVAGPRGMSSFVREAVETKMSTVRRVKPTVAIPDEPTVEPFEEAP